MLDSIITGSITLPILLICTIVSLFFGFMVALMFMYKNTYTKGFVLTLVLLPAVVQLIIMVVNGNIGTGVAIVGAFSLVRFRSVPGGAREICAVFLAMALGLATGMGYIGMAAVFFVVVGGITLLISSSSFGELKKEEKELRIVIPENLDYVGVFDDLFKKYTEKTQLDRVKTTNMGSLYELRYHVVLQKNVHEKRFLDEIRCRNGNLNVILGRVALEKEVL